MNKNLEVNNIDDLITYYKELVIFTKKCDLIEDKKQIYVALYQDFVNELLSLKELSSFKDKQ